ncbi:MAG TPA: 30S ribosomal protein S16 [Fimbriimonadaceae bacterium]|nr:30S ribosomal protein S16 [Fimbriimonadaceae bacterium]HRJ33652.1 30S ribosomal protein S16 [Fimbriimonadaceae bacterium]
MLKIRLRRMGTKARPFYRIVVAKSSAGRDGAFVEIIGTYNPVAKPTLRDVKKDRALHWLLTGAVPTDTVAHILKHEGVLDEFLAQRPSAKAKFKSLDKRTEAISQKSVVGPIADEKAAAEAPAPAAAPEPAAEPVAEAAPEVVAEAPAPEPTTEAVSDEPKAE